MEMPVFYPLCLRNLEISMLAPGKCRGYNMLHMQKILSLQHFFKEVPSQIPLQSCQEELEPQDCVFEADHFPMETMATHFSSKEDQLLVWMVDFYCHGRSESEHLPGLSLQRNAP
ncbi:unnamed protein product [Darwinula stevensoni]|uniref:Uncharacterized protein n=1 Tax=Darwinula stevensoni TaxID=69355 RepID=A0A7R8XK08_9CRUS|nr:unnamed protein product [Darwinula stevensoni]CAG0895300.1 unnamed protein product [Darwinula stevensoni]